MTRLQLTTPTIIEPKPSKSAADGLPHRLEGNAFRGVKSCMRGSSRISALIFFSAVALLAAAVLQCDWREWCLLCLAIALVVTAELLHGAIQACVHGLDLPQARAAEDMAAAAGFVATIAALVIGGVVFLHRLGLLFPTHP